MTHALMSWSSFGFHTRIAKVLREPRVVNRAGFGNQPANPAVCSEPTFHQRPNTAVRDQEVCMQPRITGELGSLCELRCAVRSDA